MPYYPRKRYTARKRFTKTVARKKPTASNQKGQIYTLAKKVDYISRSLKSTRVYSQYKLQISSTVSGDYVCLPLIQPTNWQDIFNMPDVLENKPTAWIKSIGIDSYLSIYTEKDSRMDFTIFIVSVKNGPGRKLFNDAGDTLGALLPNVHYTKNSADTSAGVSYSGQVMMNKSIFNIHYVKRCSISNRPSPALDSSAQGKATTLSSTFKRFYTKLTKLNKPLMNKDGGGGWKAGLDVQDVPRGSRYYMLCFNNNSVLDAESPLWSTLAIITMQA